MFASVTALIGELTDKVEPTLSTAQRFDAIPGWDSIRQTELLVSVEEHFGIEIPIDEIGRLVRIEDLIQAVERAMATGGDEQTCPPAGAVEARGRRG